MTCRGRIGSALYLDAFVQFPERQHADEQLRGVCGGQEIEDATLEEHAGTIFDQAENRLHVQKAILAWLVS